jgi:uncharacterized protein YcbX
MGASSGGDAALSAYPRAPRVNPPVTVGNNSVREDGGMGPEPTGGDRGVVVGRVAQLHRYPVKSLAGEQPRRVAVDRRGVSGDRLWAVHDRDGRFGSGKTTRRFRRMPGLLALRATYDDDVPVVTFPDGTSLRGDDEAVHAALSSYVGRPVTLAREGDVPHVDEGPVHLVTTSSLRAVAGGAPLDARRARANLVLDTNAVADELLLSGTPPTAVHGFPEDDWVSRRLRVGTVELAVTGLMPRCVMIGMAQDGQPDDRGVLRELLRRHDGNLGLVADVVVPGTVAVGDEARLL